MAIFLVDISALEIWFGPDAGIRVPTPLGVVPAFRHADSHLAALPEAQLRNLPLSNPLHVAVPSHAGQTHSRLVISHVWALPPPGSFVRIAPEVYVESPTAALVRVAPRMSVGACAMLLSQLMGTYWFAGERMAERAPLAARRQVAAYLEGAAGACGVGRVRELLKFVPDGLASPAEARAAALLLLPAKWGGRNLPMPEANGRIEVPEPMGPVVRFGDLLWRDQQVVLEYDSDAYHMGADRMNADAVRRTQLQAAGYAVITLTRQQLDDPVAFDVIVRALCRALGHRVRLRGVRNASEREARLRAELARCRHGACSAGVFSPGAFS